MQFVSVINATTVDNLRTSYLNPIVVEGTYCLIWWIHEWVVRTWMGCHYTDGLSGHGWVVKCKWCWWNMNILYTFSFIDHKTEIKPDWPRQAMCSCFLYICHTRISLKCEHTAMSSRTCIITSAAITQRKIQWLLVTQLNARSLLA